LLFSFFTDGSAADKTLPILIIAGRFYWQADAYLFLSLKNSVCKLLKIVCQECVNFILVFLNKSARLSAFVISIQWQNSTSPISLVSIKCSCQTDRFRLEKNFSTKRNRKHSKGTHGRERKNGKKCFVLALLLFNHVIYFPLSICNFYEIISQNVSFRCWLLHSVSVSCFISKLVTIIGQSSFNPRRQHFH